MAFLLADAHIFGCDSESFSDPESLDVELRTTGIIPLRYYLMKRVHFFKELFSCYFCLGVWCGMGAHVLLRDFWGSTYWLWHPSTIEGWLEGLLIAALIGAPLCYVSDLLVKVLENKAARPHA
jgi:hypothetical protein